MYTLDKKRELCKTMSKQNLNNFPLLIREKWRMKKGKIRYSDRPIRKYFVYINALHANVQSRECPTS